MSVAYFASLGGDAVMISFKNRTSMKDALENKTAYFGRYFSLVESWAPDLMKKEKVLWLRCRGIPIQLACGTFISVHDNTFLKQDLEVARIFLSTDSMMKIQGSVFVSWWDFQFQVSVEEETNRPVIAGIVSCRGGPDRNKEANVLSDSSGDMPAEMNMRDAVDDTRCMSARKGIDEVGLGGFIIDGSK